MSIYWKDRDGNLPPANANFHFLPFQGKLETVALQRSNLSPPIKAKALSTTFLPDKKTWLENVEKAKQTIPKVVLARKTLLELERPLDPFALAATLKTDGAFLFCRKWKTHAFLGATPERLFKREGRTILSEALAGTRPRGETPLEDQRLENELKTNQKELREFLYVKEHIEQILSPLCNDFTFTSTTVHKTHNVQHLYAQCKGTLKPHITDEEILFSLHPTPALCGTPKEKALRLIESLEPFERGLYGGAIGWSTPQESEWIVAIRSCLIEGNQTTLFSGAGIIEASDGEKEWEELNNKIKLYDALLAH